MFGEQYFATRKRLTDVVVGVRELGRRCGADVANLADEGEYLKGLRSPFLFVVCGEVNAGKSTLLNGLFSADVCKVNVLPETDRVYWYRWGRESKDVEVTPTLQERYRSIDFLQDFNIVDTPGTNSVERGHESITQRFLPVADLIIFVFPVSNPWGAATWTFIEKLPPQLRKNMVIILQQADLRDQDDINVILEHMGDLAEKKIGECPQIFAVSGKLAIKAKNTVPFDEKPWKKSGYPALENFISKRVTDNPERNRVLRDVRDSVQISLRRIESMIELKATMLEKDMAFLRELEGEVDQTREIHAQSFHAKFSGLADVFAEESKVAGSYLAEKTAAASSLTSLFKTERAPSEIEQSLIETVKNAVEQRAAHDGKELVIKCRDHWNTVSPRIQERLEITPPNFDSETNGLAEASNRFTRRLGRSARQAVVNQKIRNLLDMQMKTSRTLTQRSICAALGAVTFAGILGILGYHLLPFAFLGLAFAFLITAGWQAHQTGKEVRRIFEEKIEDCKTPFAQALSDDYKDGVRDFFIEYSNIFESVRRNIATKKLALKPHLEEWNNLFLELKAIEQEL